MLTMPPKAAVPDGPHRKFLEELFAHYREADRPTLRTIAQWIKVHGDDRELRGTASTETIRRIMGGQMVPRNWRVIETILEALCDIGGRSSDEERWQDDDDRWGRDQPTPWTFKSELKQRWNAALDQRQGEDSDELPRLPPRPVPTPAVAATGGGGYGRYGAVAAADPWAVGPSGSSDEPPF
jgi:hypothetical protein